MSNNKGTRFPTTEPGVFIRTRTETVYCFNALSPKAQAKAINWYRDLWMSSGDLDWAENVLEDADRIAKLLGIQIKTRDIPLMNGSTRAEPQIYFQLHTQGSGACFAGIYAYRKQSAKLVTDYAPLDAELARIAHGLTALQAKHNYSLTAVIEANRQYVHSHATTVWVYKDGSDIDDREAEDGVTGYMRAFMEWIYAQLNTEYDYQTSDECIRETIEANEYEFLEDGTRAD